MNAINTGFNIYPNPANSVISLEIPEALDGQVILRIFNQVGQVVYEQKINPGREQVVKYDPSGLASGLYFVNLSGDNYRASEKLVITH
jgi:hypothetical protein